MTELFGHVLRRMREQAGLSQPALAREVYVSQSTLSRMETGQRAADRALVQLLDKTLHAEGKLAALWVPEAVPLGELLPLAIPIWDTDDGRPLAAMLAGDTPVQVDQTTATRLAHEWLISDPPQVVQLDAGRRISHSLVADIRVRADVLRRMDDYLAGADMAQVVQRELDATAAVLREASCTEMVGRELLAVVAELAQLAGWVYSDAGSHDRATAVYLAGARAAHAAADRPLAANLLSSLAYQVANVGDPHEAVLIARSAATGAAGTATPTTRALLAERVAWAHARAGQPQQCERALGDVDQHFAEGLSTLDSDPEWVYWLDRDEIDIMAGRCWAQLRRPLRAVPLLRDTIGRYHWSRTRERSLYMTWLADTYTDAGEHEQAAEVADRALGLSVGVGSARVQGRLRAVCRRLLDAAPKLPAARDLVDRCRALLPV